MFEIIRFCNFACCCVCNFLLSLFILGHLKNKSLGQQTFYDKVLIAFFHCYLLMSLVQTSVFASARLHPFQDKSMAVSLTLIIIYLGNLALLAFITCLIVKTLLVYTTLLASTIFDENKVIQLISTCILLISASLQTLEFVLTDIDITEMSQYKMISTNELSFLKNPTIPVFQMVICFFALTYAIGLNLKIEWENVNQVQNGFNMTQTKVLRGISVLCLLLLLFLLVRLPSQYVGMAKEIVMTDIVFVLIPFLYIRSHSNMWTKLKCIFYDPFISVNS